MGNLVTCRTGEQGGRMMRAHMELPAGVDTVGALVRYANPCDAEESALRFRVIEDNGSRVVLRVEGWDNPVLVPTEVVARGAVVLAAPDEATRARLRAATLAVGRER